MGRRPGRRNSNSPPSPIAVVGRNSFKIILTLKIRGKKEDKIIESVSWFFDKLNIPIIENYYIDNSQNWDALCAALTILKDLQRAKKEYYSLEEINHLEAIGIMQVAYIEQDCVLTFYNSILEQKQKSSLANYKSIRLLRNEAFGHPSEKQGLNRLFSRHFFDIVDNKKQILKIINWESTGNIGSWNFYLLEKIDENSKITNAYLDEIKEQFILKMKTLMMDYKIKTPELFNGANYIFEKLLTKHHDRLVIDTYYTIEEDIEKTKEALLERNLFDEYSRVIDLVIFFSSKLKPLFYIQTYSDIEFYAYATSLRRLIGDLRQSLKELDNIFG